MLSWYWDTPLDTPRYVRSTLKYPQSRRNRTCSTRGTPRVLRVLHVLRGPPPAPRRGCPSVSAARSDRKAKLVEEIDDAPLGDLLQRGGHSRGTQGVLMGYLSGTQGALKEHSRGTHGALKGYSPGTRGALKGYSPGTRGALKGNSRPMYMVSIYISVYIYMYIPTYTHSLTHSFLTHSHTQIHTHADVYAHGDTLTHARTRTHTHNCA